MRLKLLQGPSPCRRCSLTPTDTTIWTLLKRCLLSTVIRVALWTILPSLEGEDKDPGVKDKTESAASEAKLRAGKKATLQSPEKWALQQAPCSLLPLSNPSNAAQTLVAALRQFKLREPGVLP